MNMEKDMTLCRQVMDGMEKQYDITFTELSDGHVKMTVPLKEDMMNFRGIGYGGWLFHFSDMTAGIAFLSDGKSNGVTASGDIQYLRPAEGAQTLTCIADVIKRGHSLDYVETVVYAENGKMLARTNFVFARVKDHE